METSAHVIYQYKNIFINLGSNLPLHHHNNKQYASKAAGYNFPPKFGPFVATSASISFTNTQLR